MSSSAATALTTEETDETITTTAIITNNPPANTKKVSIIIITPFHILRTLGRRHKFVCEKFIFHTKSFFQKNVSQQEYLSTKEISLQGF